MSLVAKLSGDIHFLGELGKFAALPGRVSERLFTIGRVCPLASLVELDENACGPAC